MTFASLGNLSFSIQKFIPIDTATTQFQTILYSCKLNSDNGKEIELYNNFMQSAFEFNCNVFKEDAEVCEKVQRGLAYSEQNNCQISEEEQRVKHFHDSCFDYFKYEKC